MELMEDYLLEIMEIFFSFLHLVTVPVVLSAVLVLMVTIGARLFILVFRSMLAT